jgi:hypothetical protein
MGLKPEKIVCLYEEFCLDREELFLEEMFTISTEEEWQGKFIGKINDVLVHRDSIVVAADASNMRICIWSLNPYGCVTCAGCIGGTAFHCLVIVE